MFALALSARESQFAPLFFKGDLDKGLLRAHEYGYDAVELSLASASDINAASLREKLNNLGLRVSAIGTGQLYYGHGLSLLDPDPDKRALCIRELQALSRIAAELGAPFMIVGGVRGRYPEGMAGSAGSPSARRWLVDGLQDLASSCADDGVQLLVEPINRYETDCINTVREGLDLIAEISLPNVKLLLDTYHASLQEIDVAAALTEAAPQLGYVHVADSNRHVPGDGSLPFSSIFALLRALKFEGPISVEAFPEPSDELAAARAINFCRHYGALV